MKERNATRSVIEVFTAYLEMTAAQHKFKTHLLGHKFTR